MKYTYADSRLLNDFIVAYLECLFWSETDMDTEEPFDRNYDFSDLSPEALETIIKDCTEFFDTNWDLIQSSECKRSSPEEWSIEEMAGHDFCLTRNRHGAGFWDGDWYDPDNEENNVGEQLTEASHKFPEQFLHAGDDGKLYVG